MQVSSLSRIFRLICFIVLIAPTFDAQSQSSPQSSPQPSAEPKQESENESLLASQTPKEATLLGIIATINQVDQNLKNKQEELRSPSAEGREDQILVEIQSLSNKLSTLQNNFSEVAAGVDPREFSVKDDATEVIWTNEIKDILSPLINEVRRITSRPREIDKLRSDMEESQDLLQLAEKGLLNLVKLKSDTENKSLVSYLDQTLKEWRARKDSITTQLDIVEQKLRQKLGEKQGFAQSVGNIFQLFFKSRGLNLIMALLGALTFWIIFRKGFVVTQRIVLRRVKYQNLYDRLFGILNIVLSTLGSVLVFILILYLVEDWVLLILTILLILGIVWTSKQAVYQFWSYATILLNLGSVKEGQRVIYKGIPWRIRTLNFYTNLYNPKLVGGDIKLPVKDFAELRSREFDTKEAWFPTSEKDWIITGDGQVGQIDFQTIETIQVKLLGGSIKWYTTYDFATSKPIVISNGFRHSVSFGIDYRHQAESTNYICKVLKDTLSEKLKDAGFADGIVLLDVQFEEATLSSLNLVAIVDFRGELAKDYTRLKRLINSICVDACTKNGWIIPFNQLTVHMQKE